MRTATTCLLLFAALATGGCKQRGFLAKREAEKSCPTDIRKTIPWCAGEDAIFHCPCKPSAEFYGYKPTCWGIWPTSGAEWRDVHCGNLHHEAVIADLTHQNAELITLPQLESLPVPVGEPPVGEPRFHQEKGIEINPSEETKSIEDLPELEIEEEPASKELPEEDPEDTEEDREVEVDRQESIQEDFSHPTLGLIRLPAIDSE